MNIAANHCYVHICHILTFLQFVSYHDHITCLGRKIERLTTGHDCVFNIQKGENTGLLCWVSIFDICKLDSMGFLFEGGLGTTPADVSVFFVLELSQQTQSYNIKKSWKHTSPTCNQGNGLHPNPITWNMPKKGNLSLHLFWNLFSVEVLFLLLLLPCRLFFFFWDF